MKATWWSHDQHHKQDPTRTREDPRYQAKSKHKDRNQAGRKITKKRASQHWSDASGTATGCSDQEARQQQASAAATERWGLKVTGRTDGTIHHPGNTLSIDRTLAANRPDVGTASSDREQRGSKAAKLRPDTSGGLWPDAIIVRSVDHAL
jgi:hypothetical protein